MKLTVTYMPTKNKEQGFSWSGSKFVAIPMRNQQKLEKVRIQI